MRIRLRSGTGDHVVIVNHPLRLLRTPEQRGESVSLWRNYFPKNTASARIAGIEPTECLINSQVRLPTAPLSERCKRRTLSHLRSASVAVC
jgi:hypothetical protein